MSVAEDSGGCVELKQIIFLLFYLEERRYGDISLVCFNLITIIVCFNLGLFHISIRVFISFTPLLMIGFGSRFYLGRRKLADFFIANKFHLYYHWFSGFLLEVTGSVRVFFYH
jgi:hypothetical protein